MIIQCPKCTTKFKMDDSKVKDEGTKVRCAKCKEVFVVSKEAPAPPPAPAEPEMPIEKGEFDFSFGAPPEEESPAPSFQSGGGFGDELAAPAGGVADFSFGDLPAEEPKGGEHVAPDYSFGEVPAEKPTGGQEQEPAHDFSGSSYGEVSFSETPPPSTSFDFNAEETSFGQVKFNDEEPNFESPMDQGMAEAEKTMMVPSAAEKTVLFTEAKPMKAEPAIQAPAKGFEEESFELDMPSAGKRKESRSSSLKTIALAAVILICVAIPAWYFWTNYQTAEKGVINLTDLNGYFAQNAEAGNIFVVTGKAVNNTNKSRSFFQVRGILFGKAGQKLVQKEVYCGNVFAEKELTTLPRAKIEDDLKNRAGSKSSNINIEPGKSAPFTIIFFDLPQETGEFSVEVVGSQIAS